jgi:hypothetical protein
MKKNIFIVTLGTREIQFPLEALKPNKFEIGENCKFVKKDDLTIDTFLNTNYSDFICHSFPREAGELIVNNFEKFRNVISFPIIDKTINEISRESKIDKIYFVFTNQQDLDLTNKNQSNNYKKDTLFYKEILKKMLVEKFFYSEDNFNEIEIKEKVTDIDFQYNEFAKKCKSLFDEKENIDKIYLLPQGGIDQINHALTLQLIQAFGDKVVIWQQAENTEPKQLCFTNLFLRDLVKQQIIALIDEIEYFAALKIMENYNSSKNLKKIVEFASYRKDFILNKAKNIANNYGKNKPEFIKDFEQEKIFSNVDFISCFKSEKKIQKYLFQCIERFFVAEYYLNKKNWSKFVLSISVFFENLINVYLSSITNLMIIEKYEKYGNDLIKTLKENNDSLIVCITDKLNEKKNDADKIKEVKLSFPTLILIADFYARENNHIEFRKITQFLIHVNSSLNKNKNKNGINGLDQLRNGLAHYGEGVIIEDLIKASDESNDINWWFENVNNLSKVVTANQNPYSKINDFIKNKL